MATSLAEAVLSMQEQVDRIVNGPLRADAIEGREGNLLVFQVRSGIGEKPSRRDALRTLGLRGPGSVSLRNDDGPTAGNIRKVEDLVMTVRLPERCFKEEMFQVGADAPSLTYEKIQYGTMTRPAEMVRSRSGEYFAFESDRNGALLMWGTTLGPEEFFDECLKVTRENLPAQRTSFVISGQIAESDDASEGENPHYVDTERALKIVRGGKEVSLARLEFGEFECTWISPRQPFDDMNTVCAEVHFYTESLNLDIAKALAMQTGPRRLLSQASIAIDLRRHGTRRLIPFSDRG